MKGVRTKRLFEQGRLLFNAGRFFEAHEEWEEAWRAESGTARLLLQGLIQIAAGYHKAFHDRRPDGCARLLAAGLEKLHAVLRQAPGRGLGQFAERVERDVLDASRWQRGAIEGLAGRPSIDERARDHIEASIVDRRPTEG